MSRSDSLLIRNGKLIRPEGSTGKEGTLDILVKNGQIVRMERRIKKETGKIIEAEGKFVFPGLVDMHSHLRQPGREDEETIAQTTMAAAKGGFTSICAMPNTDPSLDNEETVRFVLEMAKKEGKVNVFPIGAISRARQGEKLAPMGELSQAGVVGFSDDGNAVMNALLMRRACEYAKMFNLPLIPHCEDKNLSSEGVMNEGHVSSVLGLKGIPRQAEEIMVFRDLLLAQMSGAKIHFAHLSTKGSVLLISQAKKKGAKVSAEVTPHHLLLSEEAVRGFNTNTKINPPLRTKEDIKALQKGLIDGTIDAIATDHAPHSNEEKDEDYSLAPFGIIGLETCFPLMYSELVQKKILSLKKLLANLSYNPAKILGLKKDLREGRDADIIIVDLNKEWTIDINKLVGPCKNSPFHGWKVKGEVLTTIVKGKIVYDRTWQG